LSTSDQPPHGNFILTSAAPNDWRNPQNNNLWQGVNGTNNPCPEGYKIPTQTEWTNETGTWSSSGSNGAISSNLKLPSAGNRASASITGEGANGHYWSSTISGTSSLRYSFSSGSISGANRSTGSSVRCIKETVATLGVLNCGSSTTTGNLISGQAASGVSTSVPYTGGNGGYYAAQSVTSTGVTGLTATISAGLLANGAGNLVYTITGTPANTGTASFAITVGGQTCTFTINVASLTTLYPTGSVFCTSGPTAIVDVTNPATGKTWMDRNLGASQVATSSTAANSHGDLYQWGRRSDGHQCRSSPTTAMLSTTDQPSNGNFILAPNTPFDWRNPQNTNLWQGVNGVNNPCPNGYRLPTDTELNNERLSWSFNTSIGAFASPLKWSMPGFRDGSDGSLIDVGSGGYYWSGVVNSTNSWNIYFSTTSTSLWTRAHALGFSVRCIKN
jgi:hypothetical protein